MGLKKIFSSSSKDDGTSSIHRNSSKSSISQSISNWTHKEKEKLKHHSNNNSNTHLSISSKSSTNHSPVTTAPPRSISVTQHEPIIVQPRQEQQETNPFLSTSPTTGSLKDVSEVVTVLRQSVNGDEDEKHTHFNHITDVPAAIEEEEEETNSNINNKNPFLTESPSTKRQSYPPQNSISSATEDDNKGRLVYDKLIIIFINCPCVFFQI